MRILLVNNSGVLERNGEYFIEVNTGNFLVELKQQKHEIIVYGQILPMMVDTSDIFNLTSNGISVKGLKRRRNKIVSYILLYLFGFVQLLRTDFAYFFYPNAFYPMIFGSILLRKKYGLYIRGEEDIRRRYSKVFYKRASIVLTVSAVFSEYVNDVIGKPLAINIKPMAHFDSRDIVTTRKVKVLQEGCNMLFIGRLYKEKGIEELLRAAKLLKNGGTNFKLFIVGSGGFYEETQRLITLLELQDEVELRGFVSDIEAIRSLYLSSDLFILPSYNEGFPRTLYESMIFKVPVLTTFVGGISSIMIDGYNCIRIEPKSSDSIYDKVRYALDNEEKLQEISDNATLTVTSFFAERSESHAVMLDRLLREI